MNAYKAVETADGSVTCYHAETGELYHNRAGAFTEALVNYVEPSGALNTLKKTGQLWLLDVCFGLGYNTWVLLETVLAHASGPFVLSVLAIEKDPGILQMAPLVLADPRFDYLKKYSTLFEHNTYYQTQLGQVDFVINVADRGRIEIKILLDDLRRCVPKIDSPFDLVFHDPFAPNKVPELWSVDLFREYYRILSPTAGKFLTYSAAGAVRGGLREAGFQLHRTAGLGEKRGGTLASVPDPAALPGQSWETERIFALTAEEEAYLATRSAIPYRDSGLQTVRSEILRQREQEQQSSLLPPAGDRRLGRIRKSF